MSILFFFILVFSIVALVAGLIRPRWIIRWGPPEKKTRKRSTKICLLAMLLSFFLMIAFIPQKNESAPTEPAQTEQISTQSEGKIATSAENAAKPKQAESPSNENTSTPIPAAVPTSAQPPQSANSKISHDGPGPNGETIKGNINRKGEKIYHVPGGQFYNKTIPERWFFTEADAQAAGFRRAKR